MEIRALTEKYCAKCGKMIFPTPMWTYKLTTADKKTKYYCSYTCYKKGYWEDA